MSLFHKKVSFTAHDPLDDGLKDDIRSEQSEADAFSADMSGDELSKSWNAIVKDVEKDPSWFNFSDD